jgi:hypothetical protein
MPGPDLHRADKQLAVALYGASAGARFDPENSR